MIQSLRKHPQWPLASSTIKKLNEQGYKAYLAGGCVRDAHLNRVAKDIDIATDATPDEIIEIFPDNAPVGKDFGVILVKGDGKAIEVSSFRADGEYLDGRHPESIELSSPKEDAKRRDFTINALFYDVENDKLIDYVDGIKDLNDHLIKAVGDPAERIKEDKLRILRAIRFSVELDFIIDAGLLSVLKSESKNLSLISKERIKNELDKMIQSKNLAVAFSLLKQTSCLEYLFPDLKFISTKQQWEEFVDLLIKANSFNQYSIYTLICYFENKYHNKNALKALDDSLIFSRQEKESIIFSLNNINNFMKLDIDSLLLLNNRNGLDLFEFAILLFPKRFKELMILKETYLRLCNKETGHLQANILNGNDLVELGIPKGPKIKAILDEAYRLQIEGSINTKEEAMTWVRRYFDHDD